MREIRVGVVGIGNMGSAHARTVFQNKIKGMTLEAVCDIDGSRLEWAHHKFGEQVRCFSDYREMICADVLDAVIIATPHPAHPKMAQEAFGRGLHVLTEKPAGVAVSEVRSLNQAAKESGRVFAIMYNQRTNPLYRTLKEYLDEGKLGGVKRFVWIINNWYRTQAYYDSGDWRATWNGEGGGVLLNQCPHNLDLWQWMMGMPVQLRAFCRTAQYHRIQVEDDVTIYAEYENGANACFITSTGEYPGTNRLEISGTLGKAVIEDGKLKTYLLEQDERDICMHSSQAMPQEKVNYDEIVQDRPEQGHPEILQNFADAILEGKKLIAPGEEGIRSLLLSNAAYLSQWTDDWVTFPMEEERFDRLLRERQEQERICRKTPEKPQISQPDGIYEKRWSVKWT
ncbi:MAG: Gfo/Idh/MocA family oxidoreductase [Roseburia sp.]|nr:Gfo/Idh/MocA family oxidoreductase [Roseburia sp.]MCM1098994.1 Gfo/Idh/MocA family oxidoreductase [Ruminococcus flavefaciens]